MNNFFARQYGPEELQRRRHLDAQRRRQQQQLAQAGHRSPSAVATSTASTTPGDSTSPAATITSLDGDSLDDIMMQNTRELHRRQSAGYALQVGPSAPDRRMSMMDYGLAMDPMAYSTAPTAAPDATRRHSTDDLALNHFARMAHTSLAGPPPTYPAAMPPSLGASVDFGSPEVMGSMMDFGDVDMNGMAADADSMSLFGMQNFSDQFTGSSMSAISPHFDLTLSGMDDGSGAMPALASLPAGGEPDSAMMDSVSGARLPSDGVGQPVDLTAGLSEYASPTTPNMNLSSAAFNAALARPTSEAPTPTPTTMAPPLPKPDAASAFANIYSSSGFDMLGALMRVATRKNPEINIGAVDMSCAFVVCDVTLDDCPIIYVSEIFERLTGYSKHEVLGRNCRFLQAPDGRVLQGVKRKYVDDDSVYYLKDRITNHQEAQRSLINYRKGGQPFMNLLTMIPIAWDTDDIRYIVGFQVDLVEQPSSVAGKSSGGLYTVNYQQKMLPAYVWHPPEASRFQQEAGQMISRDEVSAVLSSYNKKNDSELMKRMWDKVLLENTDDVVHVLSLKGLFLYLSPSSRQILEYDPAELVGTALSSVCHPSDIVPVTRELKETSAGAAVNVVFRIRRKRSGYTWFESYGSLCVEQGKGRKCIVLVGRERPVYAVARRDLDAAGGVGDNELWSKLSTSGMILFVSSNVRILLDRQPEELVGTSMHLIMRPESKLEFGRSLERVRTGERAVFKHEVLNRRGQVLQAQTTLYPGDAAEGEKPTFLVGQTRLMKATSRGAQSLSSTPTARSTPSDTVDALHTPIATATPGGPDQPLLTQAGGRALPIGSQDEALAADDNIFDELKTTRSTSWQFELRQMEKVNRLLSEELATLLSNKKKRKRRKGAGNIQRDCANCHTRTTPEWRRGPSGQRDLCNSCGLRWAKQNGRVSPRHRAGPAAGTASESASKNSTSPLRSSPLHQSTSQTGVTTSNSSAGSMSRVAAEKAAAAMAASPNGRAAAAVDALPPQTTTTLLDIVEVREPPSR